MSTRPYSNINGIFSVQKMLRFALIPVGDTQKNIESYNVRELDGKMTAACRLFYDITDDRCRTMLSRALNRRVIPIDISERMYVGWKNRKENKNGFFEAVNAGSLAVADAIKEEPLYNRIFKEKTKTVMEDAVAAADANDAEVLSRLKGKVTFLTGYFTLRGTAIDGAKKGSVRHRASYENLCIYANNIQVLSEIMDAAPGDLKEEILAVIRDVPVAKVPYLGTANHDTFFSPENYGLFIGQAGIDAYNAAVEGWTDGNNLHRGVNTVLREWRQKNSGNIKGKSLSKLKKQIMSFDEGISYIPWQFHNDAEAYDALATLTKDLSTSGAMERIADILDNLGAYDAEAITMSNKEINELSKAMTGNWKTISNALAAYAENKFKRKSDAKKFVERTRYTLAEIQEAIDGYDDESLVIWSTSSDGKSAPRKASATQAIADRFRTRMVLAAEHISAINNICAAKAGLLEGKTDNSKLQCALKGLLDMRGAAAILMPYEGKTNKKGNKLLTLEEMTDMTLRNDLEPHWDHVNAILSVYRATEAYCRSKAYSEEKQRLMFNISEFLGGWDPGSDGAYTNIKNKGGIILRRNGRYYLGVKNDYYNGERKINFPKLFAGGAADTYEIMLQNKGGKANKLVAKIVNGKKNAAILGLKEETYRAFAEKTVKDMKGQALHDIIADLAECLPRHKSFAHEARRAFFKKCNPSSYASWNEFCNSMDVILYDLKWVKASDEELKQDVENGSIFLFEISSKELRMYQRGIENPSLAKDCIHDLQTVHLLDALNYRNDTQLNGGASIYFRPASLTKGVTHRAGSWLVNRRLRTTGEVIPESVLYDVYGLINHGEQISQDTIDWYSNRNVSIPATILSLRDHGGLRREPTDDEQRWMEETGIHRAKFDITKKRCYTENRYLFHVPVQLGATNPLEEKKSLVTVNKYVNDWLKEKKSFNILGINRGENNMLYAVVTDSDGRILHQQNFNILDGIDYKTQLADRTKEYAVKRDRWESPDTITDLKNGYIANALNDITKLAHRYEAVIVMEALDDKFKNNRAQLGQTVYRKFQKMLLDKLRWWVPDKKHPEDVLQLTAGSSCEGDYEPGQNGIVFLVSPWGTSSLDPATGFKDMLPTYAADKAAKKRRLFEQMKSVVFDGKDFTMTYDYKDYGLDDAGPKTEWSVSTRGERISVEKDMKTGLRKSKTEYPSEILASALENVKYKKGDDVRNALAALEGVKLDTAVKALRLTLQMRNCDIGAKQDYFYSPVVDGGLNTRKAKASQPLTTDAVTAYNLARKCIWTIKNNGEKLTKEKWLEVALP